MNTPPTPTRKPYPSDLRDAEWKLLEPLVPAVKSGRRPARHTRREIVNAILYVVQGGNQWRALPHDLPPWQIAYYYYYYFRYYFRQWRNDGTWETIHSAIREQARQRLGREATPSAAILDSQSVKSSQRGTARPRRPRTGDGARGWLVGAAGAAGGAGAGLHDPGQPGLLALPRQVAAGARVRRGRSGV